MKLSCASASRASGGMAINILSNDVVRLENYFVFLHYIWLMPIQGILVGYLIWRDMAWAGIIGTLFMTMQTVPFQGKNSLIHVLSIEDF